MLAVDRVMRVISMLVRFCRLMGNVVGGLLVIAGAGEKQLKEAVNS